MSSLPRARRNRPARSGTTPAPRRAAKRRGQLRELALGVELDLLELVGERAEVGRTGGGHGSTLQIGKCGVDGRLDLPRQLLAAQLQHRGLHLEVFYPSG
jgi:hypothetical protein